MKIFITLISQAPCSRDCPVQGGWGLQSAGTGWGGDGGCVLEGEDVSNCLLCQHGVCPAGGGLQRCSNFVGIR